MQNIFTAGREGIISPNKKEEEKKETKTKEAKNTYKNSSWHSFP